MSQSSATSRSGDINFGSDPKSNIAMVIGFVVVIALVVFLAVRGQKKS